jgi:dTDP-4-dehydrorhamnose 3,5-epimerase
MLDVRDTRIPAVKIVALRKFADSRGFFSETYNRFEWQQAGIATEFVQDNHAYSVQAHTVRGLHFQIEPFPQAKLVRVIHGAIFDVAVDLRRGSPTFGQHVSEVISAEAWNCLFVPEGFAHGFCTLQPHTEVLYKVSNHYSPQHDKGLLWNDPDLGISWPAAAGQAILSERDRQHPRLKDLPHWFD